MIQMPPDRRVLEESLGVGTQVIDPDACLVIATSGSTGDPKGAIHTPPRWPPRPMPLMRDSAARVTGCWRCRRTIAGLQVLLRALRAGYTPRSPICAGVSTCSVSPMP